MEHKKVLIADGSPWCTTLANQYLKDIGIQADNIMTVKEGSKMLELLQSQLFDVIILDAHTLCVDVEETYSDIKNTQKNPKLVEYTGGICLHKKKEMFHEVIFKPTTREDFCIAILQALDTPVQEIS